MVIANYMVILGLAKSWFLGDVSLVTILILEVLHFSACGSQTFGLKGKWQPKLLHNHLSRGLGDELGLLIHLDILHHFPNEVLLMGRWSLRDRNESM